MTGAGNNNSGVITTMLNGVCVSIQNVIPVNVDIQKPNRLDQDLELEFGVLISITGDVKGKIVFGSNKDVFGAIANVMYGMPVEGEMLTSFSGEIGNMIAGGLTTYSSEKGIHTDITSPTIMDGKTKISGYSKALKIPTTVESAGDIVIYLLLD